MATYSRSSIQITYCRWFRIRKSKCIIECNKQSTDTGKIYPYPKDPYEAKYQYLINKHEKVVLDQFKDPKAFIEYSKDMEDVYKNIEDYNPGKKSKILIVLDDMIADIINNKKNSSSSI